VLGKNVGKLLTLCFSLAEDKGLAWEWYNQIPQRIPIILNPLWLYLDVNFLKCWLCLERTHNLKVLLALFYVLVNLSGSEICHEKLGLEPLCNLAYVRKCCGHRNHLHRA